METATVGADGEATVTLGDKRNSRETWDVYRISVVLDGSDYGEAYVYEGGRSDANFLDATYDGTRNSSDYAPGTLVLAPGEFLTVVWAGATEGATATARVRYAVR